MGKVIIPSGGSPGHVRAGQAFPADRVFKWSNVEDEVVLCDEGDECEGICCVGVLNEEVMNVGGECYWRQTTGVFKDVVIASNYTTGGEWMASTGGAITAYVNSGDNRALGKFRTTGVGGTTGKITLYSG